MEQRDYDYTRPGNYPRSGRETLGGIVFLPRAIDKMRAYINGTAGEYNATRGMSARVFDLFGVTAEQFEQAVRENPTDEGVLEWLRRHGTKQPSPQEIEQFNQMMLSLGPRDDAMRERFRQNLARLGFAHRTDVTTYIDQQDLEEGRDVPRRAG